MSHITDYNYDEIVEFRMQGKAWSEINKYYGVVHPATYRWYKRHRAKLLNNPKPEPEPEPEVEEELGDYGDIPVTLFISPLSNDDWIDTYAGGEWKAKYLTELRDLIWNSKKGMYEVFRTGGKTFSCTGLFVRWMLEVRTEILCFTNAGMKDEIFRAVVDILQSDEVRVAYGDVIDRMAENKGTIRLVKELRKSMRFPNFKVIGNWSASIGSHPSWIHIEDIIQDVMVSPEANKRLRRWFGRVVKFMKKKNTKVTLTGTRKDIDDFYYYIETEHHFEVRKWEALTLVSGRYPTIDECEIDHENEIVVSYPDVGVYKTQGCPEWSLEALLYMYLFHYEDFEAEMQNNPLPDKGNFFSGADWIEVVEPPKTGGNYIIVDPAFGSSESASKTSIINLFISETDITITDAFVGRLGLDEKADMIVDFHSRHNPYQTLIEDNFRQITTRYAPDHPLMKLRGLSLIENFDNKRHRIEALGFPIKRHQIKILASCPYKNDIKAEWLSYRKDVSDAIIRVAYNVLDTLSMGYLRLNHLMSTSSHKIKLRSIGRRFR